MPKKRWDFAPEPTEQHRRIASEHRANELLARARTNEGLVATSDLLVDAVSAILDAEGLHDQREYHVRRFVSSLLSDSVFRKIRGTPPPDNS
jgi:hypothetical protein